jgi:flagellar hook-basal body complex protein FliE
MNIDKLQPSGTYRITPPSQRDKADQAGKPQNLSFSELLDNLSNTQHTSDDLIQKLASGENVDLHQVMIAVEQTDVSFKVAMAIRDKLLEAYRDVMRMNV